MAKFNNEKPQLLLHQPNSYPVGICYMMQGAQIWCCDNLEGWDRVRGGRKIQQRGNICVPGYQAHKHVLTQGWFARSALYTQRGW